MAKEKQPNYSVEDVQTLTATYTAAESDDDRKAAVEEMAKELGRSPASIRAKLVNLGVYKKAERVAKDGSKVEQKADIADDIAELCGVEAELFNSLHSANKNVLKTIRDVLSQAQS